MNKEENVNQIQNERNHLKALKDRVAESARDLFCNMPLPAITNHLHDAVYYISNPDALKEMYDDDPKTLLDLFTHYSLLTMLLTDLHEKVCDMEIQECEMEKVKEV